LNIIFCFIFICFRVYYVLCSVCVVIIIGGLQISVDDDSCYIVTSRVSRIWTSTRLETTWLVFTVSKLWNLGLWVQLLITGD